MTSQRVLFLTPHGSHLYGLAHAGSDHDFFMVVERPVPHKGLPARNAYHSLNAGLDVTVMDLSTFIKYAQHGSPQTLEAMFSRMAILDSIPELRASFCGGTRLELYERAIHQSYHKGGFKFRRHMLRMANNAREITHKGRFNPTLSTKLSEQITGIARHSTDDDVLDYALEVLHG